jgi:Ribonuclease G/E
MPERRIYIDAGPGETRGLVTLDGRAERLFRERAGQDYPRLGARYRGRVAKVDRGAGLALVDIGSGGEGALRLKADRAPPVEGQRLEVEVSIEPQGGKAAVVRLIGPATGEAGLASDAADLEARLRSLAPGAPIERGRRARTLADEAEDEALAIDHALPGGGSLAIESTRALTAVDVDLGAAVGRDPKRAARQANLNAIAAVARLLRLKGLGGLVVIDLVGRGHDGPALAAAAQAAFAPDQPGLVLGPVTRFGTLELALPRRYRPIIEQLHDATAQFSAHSLGLRLIRAVQDAAVADPGARLLARCAPEVAEAARTLAPALAGIIGARFEVVADPALPRARFEVSVR